MKTKKELFGKAIDSAEKLVNESSSMFLKTGVKSTVYNVECRLYINAKLQVHAEKIQEQDPVVRIIDNPGSIDINLDEPTLNFLFNEALARYAGMIIGVSESDAFALSHSL